jgi:hypothetical protein
LPICCTPWSVSQDGRFSYFDSGGESSGLKSSARTQQKAQEELVPPAPEGTFRDPKGTVHPQYRSPPTSRRQISSFRTVSCPETTLLPAHWVGRQTDPPGMLKLPHGHAAVAARKRAKRPFLRATRPHTRKGDSRGTRRYRTLSRKRFQSASSPSAPGPSFVQITVTYTP